MEAVWKFSKDRPEWKQHPPEPARALCGRKCGEWLASAPIEPYAIHMKHPTAIRIRRGMVYRKSKVGSGHWEFSSRSIKQWKRRVEEGESLRNWEPTPRHRLTYDRKQEIMDEAERKIPGVISVDVGRGQYEQFRVEPDLTGGSVTVRCLCGWLNAVSNCPDPTAVLPLVTDK